MNSSRPDGLSFVKYHGLGNDYMVVRRDELDAFRAFGRPAERSDNALAIALCDRHYGPGADGVLVDEGNEAQGRRLTIINPDGSEAEKSGNGLRIFSRYLWDQGVVQDKPFVVRTAGGDVTAQVLEQGVAVTVEMGTATFDASTIPVAGYSGEVLQQRLSVGDEAVEFNAVSVGNPHCVVFREPTPELATTLGAALEIAPCFVNRTNVQFVRVDDRENITIEIWERGAGYTLASGSSSCAAASVARRLGYIDSNVQVHMPGGTLQIGISDNLALTMTGPVVKVVEGRATRDIGRPQAD